MDSVVKYDSDGNILSPDELNAYLPESTYYENLAAAEEITESDSELDNPIEYHSEDEEPIDISHLVTIESYEDVNYMPECEKEIETVGFCGYKEDMVIQEEPAAGEEQKQIRWIIHR